MDIKKRHHFVSQFYLKNWLSDSKKLCIWDGKEKTFLSSTENIAFRKSFYKIVSLTTEQMSFFHRFAEKCNFKNLSNYQSVILPIFETYQTIENGKNLLKKLKIERDDSTEEFFKKIDDIEKELDNNTIEDKFSISESRFSELFERIIANDSEGKLQLNFNDYDVLAHFIAFQLAKTPQKFERITDDDGSQTRKKMMEEYGFSDDQYHVFTLYSLLCFSEQLYNATMNRLDKINIYFNHSDIRFITSDDPCFNQKFEQGEFHVQIPISPKVMIELVENNDENKKQMIEYYKFNQENREHLMVNNYLINFYEIDEKEVNILNKKILENKHQFIYVACEEDIENLKNIS